ncbi:conserved hpyothetical protein [Asticcacaulis biprosthecium C19]|uniref:Conserved hpyothetical protein n=1 Tax=Asticcacaulis biprosthecium C19 TaxID=715226 RepID=F4QFY9_9CAUL|nr:conserved hpyothetical protein [Asticcacaulis biprosthecium C19]
MFFGRAPARFKPVVICEQCNSADATAKRKLGLRKDFSFSPLEMRQFVRATPHGFHHIDYDLALRIYTNAVG